MTKGIQIGETSDNYNAFNERVPSFSEFDEHPRLVSVIRVTLGQVLRSAHVTDVDVKVEDLMHLTRLHVDAYEASAFALLPGMTPPFSDRANLIWSQVSGFLQGSTVLDLGCGDGKVAEICAGAGFAVTMVDVYKNPQIDRIQIPFQQVSEGGPLPFDGETFDNTLLLTVLHHSFDPMYVLSEANRVTRAGGSVIVIESVYGVGDPAHSDGMEPFFTLNDEEQRLYNIFFDHFYNRILHYSDKDALKVPVPFNFCTPTGWNELFQKFGFEVEETVHLGFDQVTVPEYHTLHRLKKI